MDFNPQQYNNNPSEVVTLNNVIGIFGNFAAQHKQIDFYAYGPLHNIEVGTTQYPLLYIVPQPSKVNRNTINLILDVYMLDLVKKDASNRNDTHSDTFQNLLDLKAFIRKNLYWATVDIVESSPIEPLWEKFDDETDGWKMQISLQIDWTADVCTIPGIYPSGATFSSGVGFYNVVLGSYLPLIGGVLTGGLTGTTGVFNTLSATTYLGINTSTPTLAEVLVAGNVTSGNTIIVDNNDGLSTPTGLASQTFYEINAIPFGSTGIINTDATQLDFTAESSTGNTQEILMDGNRQRIIINSDQLKIVGNTGTFAGAQYGSSYAAHYTPLSLITYGDLTGVTSGLNFWPLSGTSSGQTITGQIQVDPNVDSDHPVIWKDSTTDMGGGFSIGFSDNKFLHVANLQSIITMDGNGTSLVAVNSNGTQFAGVTAYNAFGVQLVASTPTASDALVVSLSNIDGSYTVSAGNNPSFSGIQYEALDSTYQFVANNATDYSLMHRLYNDQRYLISGATPQLFTTGSTGTSSIKAVNSTSIDATGNFAFATGSGTKAFGLQSHAEGLNTTASGTSSHAEGSGTQATGTTSHAEGLNTRAFGSNSHAEGNASTASGAASHAEGSGKAQGSNSHAEGSTTTAFAGQSHAEGTSTIASGTSAHAEGQGTTALGTTSHSEGDQTIASGTSSHAEGHATTAGGDYSHAEGYNNRTINLYAHVEGIQSTASGQASHAEGNLSTASGDYSHAEGSSKAIGTYSHAEGSSTATGSTAHSEGSGTLAYGISSHSEGATTTAQGDYSHAGGFRTSSIGTGSFVHGTGSTATGLGTVVLGINLTGNTDNTVYVSKFNINSIPSGTLVNNLGYDSNGNVIVGSSGTGNFLPLSGGSLSGDLIVNGNFTVFGTATTLNTQTISAEDNNIHLNYSGTHLTASGGGIVVLSGVSNSQDSSILIDGNGNWSATTSMSSPRISATTISATTYLNLPPSFDTAVTAFTYNNNTFTIAQNSGNTLSATINSVTGLTVNGNLSVTGNTTMTGKLNVTGTTTVSAFTSTTFTNGSTLFPTSITANQVLYATATNTIGSSAGLTYNGTDTLQIGSAANVTTLRTGGGAAFMYTTAGSGTNLIPCTLQNVNVVDQQNGNPAVVQFYCNSLSGMTMGVGVIKAAGTQHNARLDVTGSTTTLSAIRVHSGSTVTAPGQGDIWNDNTNLNISGLGIKLTSQGSKINIASGGTAASVGQITLTSGTAVVNTTNVTSSSLIFLSSAGGTITNIGQLYANNSDIVAGTSFKITSTNVLDTSTVNWYIIN